MHKPQVSEVGQRGAGLEDMDYRRWARRDEFIYHLVVQGDALLVVALPQLKSDSGLPELGLSLGRWKRTGALVSAVVVVICMQKKQRVVGDWRNGSS